MPAPRRALPRDYDDPGFRGGIVRDAALNGCILQDGYQDVHPRVADGLTSENATPVLDLGSGRSALGRELDRVGVPWVGIDRSPTQLSLAHGSRLMGEATLLPFREGTFGAVAGLYMLYHFDDPLTPMREAARVMRAGGVFVTCAPSHDNYPEFGGVLPEEPPSTFDAENGEELVARVFDDVRVERWDMFLYRLVDEEAAWTYLVARMVNPGDAREAARACRYPLWVRARGAVFWARKRG